MKYLNLLFFVLISLFLSLNGFSQTNILWESCIGGTQDDRTHFMKETSDGGLIAAGYTLSQTINGTPLSPYGGKDALVVKLNQSGNIQWAKALGGTNDEQINYLKEIPNQGYIMVGSSASNNGDVGVSYGAKDIWVIKISTTGSVLWSKVIGGMSNEEATSVYPTSDGGFIIAGYSFSTNMIYSIGGAAQPNGNHGNSDVLLAKLDSMGNVQWAKCYGGTMSDRANSVIQHSNGTYMIVGYSESNDCDVTGNHQDMNFFPPVNTQDIWVLNVESNGQLVWQKSIGGSISENANEILETSSDDIVFTGYTYSNDGDMSANQGQKDVVIAKMTPAGSLIWLRTIGGIYDDLAMSINLLPSGGFLLSGSSSSNAIAGNQVVGNGFYDFMMLYTDYTGNYLNHTLIGGTGWDYGRTVLQTVAGDYIVGGYTNSVNGNFSTNNGSFDFGVLRLSSAIFPIELLSLEAKLNEGNSLVEWKTNREINSSFFAIERSVDNGQSFEVLDYVKAAGNTENATNYNFTDVGVSNINKDKVFYRLKMVDIDNSFEYSGVVEVRLKKEIEIYANVYPVPSQDFIQLEYQLFGALWGEIKIINQLGQVIYSSGINAENTLQNIELDIRDWEAGVYYIQIYTEQKTITRKIIKE